MKRLSEVGAIYLKQAIKEMERGIQLTYKASVRRSIQRMRNMIDEGLVIFRDGEIWVREPVKAERQLQATAGSGEWPEPENPADTDPGILVHEDGMIWINEEVKAYLELRTTRMINGRRLTVSPFDADMIDDLAHLESLDDDYVKHRNGEGFRRDTAFKARRILTQFDNGCLAPDDFIDGESATAVHWDQMTAFYAAHSGMRIDEVASIREDRQQAGDLTSTIRITSRIVEDFSFIDCTYLYTDPDGLAVHVTAGSARPLSEYRKAHEDDPAFQNYYGPDQERFDGDRKRTVNGKQYDYPSLLFPPEPYVAAALIDIVERCYPHALIDPNVRLLAARHDPDLDPRNDDGNDPSVFRR